MTRPLTWPLPDAGSIHVLITDLDSVRALVPDADATLSLEERTRTAAFKLPEHAEAFRQRRALLRTWLTDVVQPGAAPSELGIHATRHGRRWLPDHPHIDFNASSAGDRIAIALARRDDRGQSAATAPPPVDCGVGIDIEVHREMPDVDLVARVALSASEHAAWRSAVETDGADATAAFLELWTRKEAVSKAGGVGIGGEGGPAAWPIPTTLDATATPPHRGDGNGDGESADASLIVRPGPRPTESNASASRRAAGPIDVASWSPAPGVCVSLARPGRSAITSANPDVESPAAAAAGRWPVATVDWRGLTVRTVDGRWPMIERAP